MMEPGSKPEIYRRLLEAMRLEGAGQRRLRENQPTSYLVCPYTDKQRWILNILAGAWTILLLYFYLWWFDRSHVVTITGFVVATLALFWITLLPSYFIFFILRARAPNPNLKPPFGWRVAMIATKVPSEPLSMLKNTLRGMLKQRYPHDVWLADEDPDEETVAWCKQHGIEIISRKDVADYHRPDWPRRTRCKEGNLAYFYDNYGYAHYDFVVQMDADHVPQPQYLEEILRPFV